MVKNKTWSLLLNILSPGQEVSFLNEDGCLMKMDIVSETLEIQSEKTSHQSSSICKDSISFMENWISFHSYLLVRDERFHLHPTYFHTVPVALRSFNFIVIAVNKTEVSKKHRSVPCSHQNLKFNTKKYIKRVRLAPRFFLHTFSM